MSRRHLVKLVCVWVTFVGSDLGVLKCFTNITSAIMVNDILLHSVHLFIAGLRAGLRARPDHEGSLCVWINARTRCH